MNTSNIKKVAPQARRDFIGAVTKRLNELGIYSDGQIAECSEQGELLDIEGRHFDVAIKPLRDRLVTKVKAQGFSSLVENVAYTWFNRFCAIRYMELHDYLDHGIRVLSHPSNPKAFEVLEHAQDIAEELGLDRGHIIELKLAGNKEEVLYRELLTGQCHQLHKAMPFLFEALDDETELLLPDNLTRTDSILRSFVDDIPEEDWQQIEVIGWLYQFYISEKKDQVMGKVVKSEDIPAATQLFTPNWIVKYMIQNSLGAQWLATYPDSSLKSLMEYYIESAEQTDEVNAQLVDETPKALNPEELTLIDPACGSGHILVEGYELFKVIYLERGYRQRDVAQLILEKNLFGFDIDERAAQLTGFALMMKARADDRRLFQRGVKLNVMALVDSAGFDTETLTQDVNLADYDLQPSDLTELKQLFEHATTFGSLIRISDELVVKLPALRKLSQSASQDLFVLDALNYLEPLVRQAEMLAAQYDAVVANPPYMGAGAMNKELKQFCSDNYPKYKLDLYSAFTKSLFLHCKERGVVSTIVMHSWMFVLKYESMRDDILENYQINSMLHLGTRAFEEMSGEVVQTVAFCATKQMVIGDYLGSYVRLVNGSGDEKKAALLNQNATCFWKAQRSFKTLPGKILCYWASDDEILELNSGNSIANYGQARHGLVTSDNNRFLRFWWEVNHQDIGYEYANALDSVASKRKWFPYNKGGSYRKWYGNNELVVNWFNDGEEIVKLARDMYGSPSKKVTSREYYFKSGLTWSALSSDNISMRSNGPGYLFDSKGSSVFFDEEEDIYFFMVYLNSRIATRYLNLLCPTLDYNAGSIAKVPVPICSKEDRVRVLMCAEKIINLAKKDWNLQLKSMNYDGGRWLSSGSSMDDSWKSMNASRLKLKNETREHIEEAERIFLKYLRVSRQDFDDYDNRDFGLPIMSAEGFSVDVIENIIGCMMGRYSLDVPELIYAHCGNEGFDSSCYTTFPADDDGIIPLTDTEWFADDAANRLFEFMSIAWDSTTLEKNLTFLSENLSPKKNETSRKTIRRYLCTKFFKDHLKTYKKRPIYWLFSSGKQKAFECLVYLHRYNEGTLARMRTEYVTPLLGKYDAHMMQLQKQLDDAATTAEANRYKKEQTSLQKKQNELREFDDKLKHYADMRINIDLDDGVKMNYGKFGDLLAEVKAITGKKAETQ